MQTRATLATTATTTPPRSTRTRTKKRMMLRREGEGEGEKRTIDKLGAAQHQDHVLEALEKCRKNMGCAYKEFSNYRALHESAWVDVKETGSTSELKRKAEKAHTRTYREREIIRRAASVHVKDEEVHKNRVWVGCRGPHLKESLAMIKNSQSCSRRSSENHADQKYNGGSLG